MKKLLLIVIALILLAIAAIYILIPGKITIARTIIVPANREALLRKMENEESWKRWWPGNTHGTDTAVTYLLKGISFKPRAPLALSVPMSVDSKDFVTSAEFTFFPYTVDSTGIHIETTVSVSNNPVKRVRQYIECGKLAKDFTDILESVKSTYSRIVNLYDFDIQKKSVVDSILISTFEEIKGYPSADKIYELIDKLKGYIKKNGAGETGFPMLHINAVDSVNYRVKVAIPVNKKLPGSGDISYKWMLGGGNILITEVKGGHDEINKAYKQILNYITDHNRIAPAIPFESLVTDRSKEPDSSKWITRIYYPVM